LGFKNNKDALGKWIWMDDSTQTQIAGVINNFYFEGVGRAVQPLALRSKAGAYNNLFISINAVNHAKVTSQLERIWKKLNPGKSFSYTWLDQKLRDSNNQSASISLLGFLAFMTVAIASLGLLGLVIYTVETRRKEISIRKIVGAGVNQLMILLSKGFVKLLIIAGLIAMPIGYILSIVFLQNFANRVEMRIGSVIICFLFLLSIGLITIISQTYRASSENPAKNLRTE